MDNLIYALNRLQMKQLWCTIREPLRKNIHRLFPWLQIYHIGARKACRKRYLSPAFAKPLLCTALLQLWFYWIPPNILFMNGSFLFVWIWWPQQKVKSWHFHVLYTWLHTHSQHCCCSLCHILFSHFSPWDVEDGYRFLQHTWQTVKGKYSCGSLVKYSKKDLWLFFRWHCIITTTSVEGGQIYLSAMHYYDGKTLEYHLCGYNSQLLVIDLALFHTNSQPDSLQYDLCQQCISLHISFILWKLKRRNKYILSFLNASIKHFLCFYHSQRYKRRMYGHWYLKCKIAWPHLGQVWW